MRGAVFAILMVGCFSPSAPFGLPCAENGDCPEGQQCDELARVCTGPTELRTLRDDTAADFAAGAYLEEVTIEGQGFVGPTAYFTGGLRVSGIAGDQIPDPTAASFDAIAANPIAGTLFVRRPEISFLNTANAIGLPSTDGVTVLLEGELELDVAGTWLFRLDSNDAGFLELAPAHSRDFVRLVSSVDAGGEATFEAPAAGWYRFRIAAVNIGTTIAVGLRYDPPNQPGNFREIPVERLRAPAGDVQGLVVDGFEFSHLLFPFGSVTSTESLANLVLGANPFGIPVGQAYSLRWSGQFLVDVEGDYAFAIDTRDGHRAWIDGVQVADAFTDIPRLTLTEPMRLAAGWHDLVLDLHESSTADATLSFTIASGPERVGESFPADHLRPVIGRKARWFGGGAGANVAIPDGGNVSRFINLELPSSFLPIAVEVGYGVTHNVLTQVQAAVDPPVGATQTITAAGTLTGTGDASFRTSLPASTAGVSWQFILSDTVVDMVAGTVTHAAVTQLAEAGVPPFEPRARYESAVRELPSVKALGPLTWGVRQGTATETAALQVRTCDDPAACAAEPWTDVALGATPAVPARRFFQYAVDLTTNGDVPTALDFVELSYSAAPGL